MNTFFESIIEYRQYMIEKMTDFFFNFDNVLEKILKLEEKENGNIDEYKLIVESLLEILQKGLELYSIVNDKEENSITVDILKTIDTVLNVYEPFFKTLDIISNEFAFELSVLKQMENQILDVKEWFLEDIKKINEIIQAKKEMQLIEDMTSIQDILKN